MRGSRRSLAATLLVAFACRGESRQADSTVLVGATQQSARDCGIPPGDVQIDEGAGVLRAGVPASQVLERCEVVLDTTVLDNEGMPARELVIALGADTAVAEVVADSVWRVRFSSSRFRSSDGIGVGSAVSVLKRLPGARALVGEGEVYVTVPTTCGVSYRIAGADYPAIASAPAAEAALRRLPDTARVDRVLVFACAERAES